MPTIAEAFASALALHQAGNLLQAEQLYRQILQVDPSHADSYHLLGVIANQVGRPIDSVALIRHALTLNAVSPVYYTNLGVAHEALGQLDEAVFCYLQAIHLEPNNPGAHNNLGNVLSRQGRFNDAVALYVQAVRLLPDFAEPYNGLANALASLGKLDEAIVQFQTAVRIRPDYPEAHNGLANSLLSNDQLADAVAHFQHALQLRPQFAEAHSNLANALLRQGKPDEAVAAAREALRLNPRLAEAYNNLGIALQRQGQLDEAVANYRQALQLKPNYAEASTNLGNIHRDNGQLDQAVACYDDALRHDPSQAELHHNRALLQLLLGHWPEAWPEYEWRWQTKDFPRLALSEPRWDGSPLAGRTLLVVCEQGLGDTLQFVRCLPLLQERGGHVILQCQPRLQRLLKANFPSIDVVAQDAPPPQCDTYVPLLSLPGILRTTPANVTAPVPYLRADANLISRWRRDIQGLCGPFLIGIAWQGLPANRHDRERSIPLTQFAPLARVPGVRLISLQVHSSQLSALSSQPEQSEGQSKGTVDQLAVHYLGSALDEASGPFMDTAALMHGLDLVITADTAVAHLAGAMGIPVWVALPWVPDWRWLLKREDSPWYPTMRLFRQTQPGCWPDVFERIAAEVRDR